MTSVLNNNFLSLDQNINRFFMKIGIELRCHENTKKY